jgi:hypothetical protein
MKKLVVFAVYASLTFASCENSQKIVPPTLIINFLAPAESFDCTIVAIDERGSEPNLDITAVEKATAALKSACDQLRADIGHYPSTVNGGTLQSDIASCEQNVDNSAAIRAAAIRAALEMEISKAVATDPALYPMNAIAALDIETLKGLQGISAANVALNVVTDRGCELISTADIFAPCDPLVADTAPYPIPEAITVFTQIKVMVVELEALIKTVSRDDSNENLPQPAPASDQKSASDRPAALVVSSNRRIFPDDFSRSRRGRRHF